MGSAVPSGECAEQVNITRNAVSAWTYNLTDTYMIAVFIPIIWCLGIVTNSTFLLVFFRVPRMRSETNLYLVHLTIADLLYLCLASVYRLWSYSASRVVFNIPFSHAAPFLAYITIANTGYYSSINLVTIVSLERYLALCHPMKHLRMRGRSRTYKMIAICWLLAFLFAIPISLTMAVFIVMCLQWPEDDTYQEFPSTIVTHAAITPWLYKCVPPLMNLPWIICMLSSIYMYVRILQALNKRGDESSVTRNDPNAAHIRNQVAKMLIVNGTVFFLCQVPYRIITLSAWICWMANIPDPIYAALGTSADLVSQVPQYINGMINPLIYGAINKQYRVAFIEAFRCLTHPGRDNASLPSVSTTVQSPTRTISKNSDTEL